MNRSLVSDRFMRPLHRWILRMLGVSYHLQNVFLDKRRWTVTVTSHAIEQAGERYRQGDPKYIALDVLSAYCLSRYGDRTPNKRHGAQKGSLVAWTEDQTKVYVIARRKRNLLVVTALPTAWSDAEAERRVEQEEARKEYKATTKVAQAFLAAQERIAR